MERRLKVGVFDSGVGGLTVLGACLKEISGVDFYYFGDNTRAPYGERGEGEITAFVREAMGRFERLGVDAAVIACNTATTVCIGKMREEFAFPIIGTEPAIGEAARECSEALVLATPRTAESDRLRSLIESFPACRFHVIPCEGSAGEIEAHLTRGGNPSIFVHFSVPEGICYDGAVLGCTHYIFFQKEIERILRVKTYHGNRGVARRLKEVLSAGNSVPKNSNICFEKKVKETGGNRVFFVGKTRFLNRKVFEANIRFKNI